MTPKPSAEPPLPRLRSHPRDSKTPLLCQPRALSPLHVHGTVPGLHPAPVQVGQPLQSPLFPLFPLFPFSPGGYLQPHVKLSAVSGRGLSLPPHAKPRGGEAMCSCSKAHQRTQSQMQPSCGALPAPGGWREARSCPALGSAGLCCPHPAPGTASSPCTAPSSSEGEPRFSAGFKSYSAIKLNSNYCISHISDFYRANINC